MIRQGANEEQQIWHSILDQHNTKLFSPLQWRVQAEVSPQYENPVKHGTALKNSGGRRRDAESHAR